MATSTPSFRVEGMHCGSCAMLVDRDLEDLPGLRPTWTTQGSSVGALDANRNSPEDVVATPSALGNHACLLP
ncbi:cation transporter [Rhodococcus opacus]|uniref:heavy-metal-associated domain-containing protein n=1 Tax=Rhodococcus TaxID=1827 RepID=UPI001320218D|nr:MULTISPECIES: heavy-metal-associated domain-containing protein [Rhodococcus]MDX5961864.1 cation transporter [Rhodococcus opacus]QHE74350.1 Heavy metal transport/detoxification protein [Rhodococcus sp. WAY2]